MTQHEREVLEQLVLRPYGAPVRDPELKAAVLSLASRQLVCDPHTMGTSLFTRITPEGRAALNATP